MVRTALLLLLALPAVAPAQTTAPAPDPGASAPSDAAPYKVVDGYKVDAETMEGFRAWRAVACDRCHGAEQEGSVGPSLIASLQQRSKDDVIEIILEGRQARGMPAYKTVPTVKDNIEELYAYLKGRSDGAITRAKVVPIERGE